MTRKVLLRSLAGQLGLLLVLAVVAAQVAALLVFLGEKRPSNGSP